MDGSLHVLCAKHHSAICRRGVKDEPTGNPVFGIPENDQAAFPHRRATEEARWRAAGFERLRERLADTNPPRTLESRYRAEIRNREIP